MQDAARLQSQQQWVTDPNFRSTTLLLQADNAANSAQNNTFLDSSSNSFAITRNGNTTQGTFTPFSQGWSNYFSGTSDNLKFASNAAFAVGNSNFTVECFVNFSAWASTNQRIFVQGQSGTDNLTIQRDSGANNLIINIQGSSSISYAWVPNIGQWYHIAVVKSGTGSGQVVVYINGISVATGTSSTSISQNQVLIGGIDWASGYNMQGYISNLRYTVGAALYTGNFTPPTEPLTTTSQGASASQVEILTCQSNRFIDNSTNAFSITVNGTPSVQPFAPFAPQFQYTQSVIGGSGYFDGTGDYLSVASATPLTFGTGDFTVEGWFYATALGGQPALLNIGSDAAGLVITFLSAKIYAYFVGAGNVFGSTGATLATNTWYHFAWVRSGSTHTFYINGAAYAATYSSAGNHSSTGGAGIGYSVAGTVFAAFTGYIANVRMVKGTAVYTGAFTPPIAPVTTSGPASSYSSTTNVNTSFTSTNTSLLTQFTNAGIIDGTMKNNLETVGNAQVSTSVVKYGSGSLAFDGTGDYLTSYNGGGLFRLGTIYTVEMWFYTTTVAAGNAGLINFGTTVSGNTGFNLYRSTAEILCNDGVTGGTGPSSGAGSVVANLWTHLAIVSNGVTTKVYLNGVERGSYTGTTGSANSMTYVTIGAFNDKTSAFAGYIDDLRVTRGIARYTQNFIPPSVALPRQ